MTKARKKFAAALAGKGFNIFRLRANDKKPVGKGWQKEAAQDATAWANGKDFNVGVATGGGLLVVDIDMKDGVDGETNWKGLGIEESSFQVKTPSGGRHIYYTTDVDVSNSASQLCDGVDIRGVGGYVVGPGSELDGVAYMVINTGAVMLKAPDDLIALCNKKRARVDDHDIPVADLDTLANIKQAKKYLDKHAHVSIEGGGGDQTAFSVAARVRDMGISETKCLDMMLDDGWNDRCEPPWSGDELETKISNAYKYSSSKIGQDTPEAQFSDEPDSGPVEKRTLSPYDQFFKKYAFIAIGNSHVVAEEYLDKAGRPKIQTYGEKTFHGMTVRDYFLDDDDKKVYMSRLWIMSEKRRTYRGFTFDPSVIGPVDGKYNHWRGFTHQPTYGMSIEDAKAGCDKFLKHIRDNICGGDMVSYRWILNHFAHLIQYPWKKPETAIVVTGLKGVGKSLMFEIICQLVRNNHIVTAEKRMLLGQFNSHMESLLAFLFEEAFWAGDKAAEGKLKHIITGKEHAIERKGYEPYMVGNFARIYITSNNDWAIPATTDERRFGVFACGDAQRGNKGYFSAIFDQLEGGDGQGYRCLMTLLSLMDVDKTLVHVPPKTQALADQKEETLDMEGKWLRECLVEGVIDGTQTGFEEGDDLWIGEVSCKELHEAYKAYSQGQGFRYPRDARAFGKRLHIMLGKNLRKTRITVDNKRGYYYQFDGLEDCRGSFESWFGHTIEWE
jgi:hypothetical protein